MALDDELLNKVTWKVPNALAVIGSRPVGRDPRVFVKFSKPAVDDGSTLNGRAVRQATTGAPVFDAAVAWMDREVCHQLDLGTHTLFVGEVVDAAINDGDARAASMSDTIMKYGGVKRHYDAKVAANPQC